MQHSHRSRPYTHAQLRRLLDPRSVAVMGASPREGSFGAWTVRHLADFKGPVYPVNPKYQEIDGQRCHPDLADLPEVPDCAIVVAGRDAVEDMVRACARAGVGGVVIYAVEAASRVVDRMIQVMGAMELSRELPLEAWYRDLRVARILEGSSEILRTYVARAEIGPIASTGKPPPASH